MAGQRLQDVEEAASTGGASPGNSYFINTGVWEQATTACHLQAASRGWSPLLLVQVYGQGGPCALRHHCHLPWHREGM